MSDTPNTAEGDTEVPSAEPSVDNAHGAMDASERLREHEIWVAGTEEPEWIADATDEGAQEMLPRDIEPGLDVQRGVVVDDECVQSPRLNTPGSTGTPLCCLPPGAQLR